MKDMINIESLRIEDTTFPAPWKSQLEFSSPARGTWNIVHTGMLIPESHQIFVCAKGCLRGVVLTAAEMGEMGRYSALEIREENVLNGDMETMMIDGVTDIIEKLSVRPRAIELFISCQHFFLAYDQKLVFRTLEEKFPDISFVDCYMIPTLRKSGITPDQRMRVQMYRMLEKGHMSPSKINHIGSNHRIKGSSEIYTFARRNGYVLQSIHDFETFDEYLEMADACFNIVTEPLALKAAEDMEARLGIPYAYVPNVFRFSDIEEAYRKLSLVTGDLAPYRMHAEAEIDKTKKLIGDAEIVLDYTFTFRTLNLARFLVEKGFNVTDIYIDSFLPEEEDDWKHLKENRPDIMIHPTNRPSMRFEKAGRTDAIALGQKAAEFAGTDHFVNIAEGGGLFGFAGVAELMELMRDAYRNEKDRREVIQKKGFNQRSLLDESECLCSSEPRISSLTSTGIKSSASLIPTYSSDEFGACSSLYELGGMVVMHDASGCNSTYTTHDEPRWYDHQSMIYISAISEMEAIMGDDDKLIKDMTDATEELHPRFAAIVGAPIPYMTGIDLDAISEILKSKLEIPVYGIHANGMNDYTKGIEMALEALTDDLTEAPKENSGAHDRVRVNLLGITPLDYANPSNMDELYKWISENGMIKHSSFTMDSSIEEIRDAANADVNLVLSSGGLKTAKKFKLLYGIPYVIGAPLGRGYATELAKNLKDAASGQKPGSATCERPASADVLIIGEAVTSVSLARALEKDYGIKSYVAAGVSCDKEILREGDRVTPCEDAVIAALEELKPRAVIADPFYRAIVNEKTLFIPLPHEAFSGRIFDKEAPCLVNTDLDALLQVGEINA